MKKKKKMNVVKKYEKEKGKNIVCGLLKEMVTG